MTPTRSPVKKIIRKTPKSADKVLDAPCLINDFCKAMFKYVDAWSTSCCMV